jgi:hypothetical protein
LRDGCFEGRLDRFHWLSIELDEMMFRNSLVMPAAKMGEQARWQRDRRLPFVAGLHSLRQPVIDASLKIDVGVARLRDR